MSPAEIGFGNNPQPLCSSSSKDSAKDQRIVAVRHLNRLRQHPLRRERPCFGQFITLLDLADAPIGSVLNHGQELRTSTIYPVESVK